MRCVADEDCGFLYKGSDGKQQLQRYPLLQCQAGWCRQVPKASMSKAQRDIAARPACTKLSDCCRGRDQAEAECAFLKECREGVCVRPLSCSPQTCRGDLRYSEYTRAECLENKCSYPCAADADCIHYPNGEPRFRHTDECFKGQCVHRCTEANCDRDDRARGHPRGMGCAPSAASASND